jgi:hypothetical protein
MSQEINTLLPGAKYMTASDGDQYLALEMKTTAKYLNDLSITDYLDIADQFDSERQTSEKYRVMGNFNYISLLRDLKQTYTIDSLSELFENNNYQGKEYNFDYYFDIKIAYPYQFLYRQAIDANKSLYLSRYWILTSVTYQQIKSAYQENSYNELMWNAIANQFVDLTEAKIHINDLDINIPLTEMSLYISLKDKSRLKAKVFSNSYSLKNIFLHTGTTLGYNDELFDSNRFDNGDFDVAISELNDKANTGYYDVEFISTYRTSLMLLFKYDNIELTGANIRLNAIYLKHYLQMLRDASEIQYMELPTTGNTIDGGYIVFDKNDFTWEKSEGVDHKFHIDYNYGQDFFIQFAKEGISFLEDYARVYYPMASNTQNTVSIGLNRLYIQNNALNIICSISDLTYFSAYVSSYANILESIPHPLRFNNVTYTQLNTNQIILTISKKSIIEQPNNLGSSLKIYFKYNPFIHIKYKEYTTALQITDDVRNVSIPDYAIYNNNLYKWRNPLDKGFIEPDTEIGFDYPFLNDNTYIDNNLRFYVPIDKTDIISNKIFSDFASNVAITGFKQDNNQQGTADC